MVDHDKLYDGAPPQQQQSSNDIHQGHSPHEGPFRGTVARIKDFCATSDRLRLLGFRIFLSVERELREVETIGPQLEEAANAAFRKLLAWKAIQRRVFK